MPNNVEFRRFTQRKYRPRIFIRGLCSDKSFQLGDPVLQYGELSAGQRLVQHQVSLRISLHDAVFRQPVHGGPGFCLVVRLFFGLHPGDAQILQNSLGLCHRQLLAVVGLPQQGSLLPVGVEAVFQQDGAFVCFST